MIDRNHKEADCAIRIRKNRSDLQEQEAEGQQASTTSEAELSWDELTNCSQTFSETSSIIILHQEEEEAISVIPRPVAQPEAVRPSDLKVASDLCRAGSPEASAQLSWEVESLMDTLPHTNKIMVTSGSFRLPWSLEAVIRPDSPRMGSSHVVDLAERYYDYCWPAQKPAQHHYKSGTYPTISPLSVAIMSEEYSEEDYADDLSEAITRSGSVVAKTVRLPVSLASDMLIFLLKFLWPGKQQRPSDHAVHGRSEAVATQATVMIEGSA